MLCAGVTVRYDLAFSVRENEAALHGFSWTKQSSRLVNLRSAGICDTIKGAVTRATVRNLKRSRCLVLPLFVLLRSSCPPPFLIPDPTRLLSRRPQRAELQESSRIRSHSGAIADSRFNTREAYSTADATGHRAPPNLG